MDTAQSLVCGIVMPISAIDNCSETHWTDVQDILTESIELAGFVANIVSNADEVGIIHKRIIQNLYDNPMVVVDISGKNPNVMFELGMRLAFDKPTLIVKDDVTNYSFDTSAIEHLEYPRDLRFGKIVDFKIKLAEKIKATYKKSIEDSGYTTFLKHFGEFIVAKIDKKEIPGQEFIIDELRSMRMAMQQFIPPRMPSAIATRNRIDLCMGGWSESVVERASRQIMSMDGVLSTAVRDRGPDHKHIMVRIEPDASLTAKDIYARIDLPPRKSVTSNKQKV